MRKVTLAEIPDSGVSHHPEIRKKVILGQGAVPHLTNFSQARFTPGQTAAGHSHPDMFEVFFVESGTGAIKIDDVEHSLTPGVCVTVEPGESHEISNTGPVDLVLTYLGIEA